MLFLTQKAELIQIKVCHIIMSLFSWCCFFVLFFKSVLTYNVQIDLVASYWPITWLKCSKAWYRFNQVMNMAQYFLNSSAQPLQPPSIWTPLPEFNTVAANTLEKDHPSNFVLANPKYNFYPHYHCQQTIKITICSYMCHTKYFKPYLIFQSQI